MRSFLALLALTSLAGCSASSNVLFGTGGSSGGPSGSTGSATTGSATTGSAGTGGSGAGGSGAGGFDFGDGGITGAGGGVGGMAVAEVYGQTPDTLYKLDPDTDAITMVGTFQGCDSDVIDIALDKSSNMYGTTFGGVYKIDRATAACSPIATGSYPNSLSFVPAGTVDPSVEALVGYNGSSYVRIDTTTGSVTTIGALSGGYESSGDIVSVIDPAAPSGADAYLTVTGGPEGCGDCILQVDPKTGDLIKNIGPLGHGGVYGLAFWGGSCYGFDAEGDVFKIDLTNGSTTDIPVPNAPPGLTWYGAGSTTSAPLTQTM